VRELASFLNGITTGEGVIAMRKLAIMFGGAALLAACQSTPPPPPPAPPVDLNNPLMAPGFLAQAGSANQWEIESSQLALQMSTNPAVRSLANVIIADHTAMGQQVAAAASSAGLTPPAPGLLPPQQSMLDQLRTAGSGPAFDMAYQQAQISAHQQAIQLMQNYAAQGDVPALRTVASQAIPVMQKHLSMAQALNTAPPPPPPPPMPSTRRSGERG
jgi:putative membrane protein